MTSRAFVTSNTLTSEQAAEVLPLSVQIAHAVRSAHIDVDNFYSAPIHMRDMVELTANRSNAWAERIVTLPFKKVREARAALTRLTELLGTDASVVDHGWANGLELISLAAMEQAVTEAEALMLPLYKLRTVLGLVHKSVQAA
jgi:hypothetical protein